MARVIAQPGQSRLALAEKRHAELAAKAVEQDRCGQALITELGEIEGTVRDLLYEVAGDESRRPAFLAARTRQQELPKLVAQAQADRDVLDAEITAASAELRAARVEDALARITSGLELRPRIAAAIDRTLAELAGQYRAFREAGADMTAALKVLGYDGAEVGKHDGLTGAIANASIELAEATGQVEPTKWNNAFYDKRVPASELWYRRSMADETEENGASVRRVLAELKQEKEAA